MNEANLEYMVASTEAREQLQERARIINKPKCRTCEWFSAGESDPLRANKCHRHAPSCGAFPSVFDGDWCGDHEPRR